MLAIPSVTRLTMLTIGARHMKVFASHETALDYWREHFSPDMEIGCPVQASPDEAYAYTKEDVLGCYPELYADPDKPVHALVFNDQMRRPSKQVVCHKWTVGFPEGAFFGWGDFRVSSPEFLFLQMASELTIAQLVALGCELCGTYILLPKGVILPSSFDDYPERVAPLTNIASIEAFLNAIGPARGVKKARRALKYVAEGSRSPMETRTYMQLCLPPVLGGYGFPKAELNPEIPLDEEARRIVGSRSCWGDVCWPKKQLDIEYHGDVHFEASKVKRDAGRALGIEHMGWRVITVTSPQVLDIERFEIVANEVAEHLGHRLRPNVLGETSARRALHYELDAWMSRV